MCGADAGTCLDFKNQTMVDNQIGPIFTNQLVSENYGPWHLAFDYKIEVT